MENLNNTPRANLCQAQDAKCTSPNEQVEGLEIVSAACQLQQEVINTMLDFSKSTSSTKDSASDFVVPFCHWILTGLCHMFCRPVWIIQGWKLPIMKAALRNEQALLALKGAEIMIERSGLDAIFYATMTGDIAAAMTSVEDRKRVIGFLQKIKAKGFTAASRFESDIQHGWKGGHLYSKTDETCF